MTAVGARYKVVAEDSSYTTTWASRVPKLIARYQPDLVLVTVGANEVQNSDPSTHAPAVRRIVHAIGKRPCVFIAPPLWRKDTGIIDVLREHSAPCRFFDTDALIAEPIARMPDHIHPNREGGVVWADAFWAWLEGQRAAASSPPEDGGTVSPWTLKPAPPNEHIPPRRQAAQP